MSVKLLVIIYFTLIHFLQCFNIDTNFPILYSHPNKRNGNVSYFGYSVILFEGTHKLEPWIQIGAPRESNFVYRCGIKKKCTVFSINTYGKRDGSWIGATMDIQTYFQRIVMCGYRWITSYGRMNYMPGACYWSQITENETEVLLPLRNENYYVHNEQSYYFAMGQAGMSAHFPSAIDKPELVLGAPGVFNWKGSVLLYRDGSSVPSHANKRAAIPGSFSRLIIPDMTIVNDIYSFGYFGYSVSSGYFFTRDRLLYVAGAPRSNAYRGQILIFDFPKNNFGQLHFIEIRHGQTMGEYFGAAISVADINGDNLDDVIIGAPHYSTQQDEGRIYIYIGNKRGNLLKPDQSAIIDGKSIGGQFGLAIQSLGDLDLDGFKDIAVGAPYEDDNHGVVYIYNGGPNGLSSKPSQRITAKQISIDLKGFGYSFSRPTDVDNNRFGDLAIGSYLSGHAVLLRTRPVVRLQMFARSLSARLDHNAKNVTIEICLSYLESFLPPTLNINRTVLIDPVHNRTFFDKKLKQLSNSVVTIIILHRLKQNCENITIRIRENLINYLDSVEIIIQQDLVEKQKNSTTVFANNNNNDQISDTVDHFCKYCPVTHPMESILSTKINVPFALDCGDDNVCISDLKLSAQFHGLSYSNAFVIGAKSDVPLVITINNMGEAAYLTQIEITLPNTVHLVEIPAACSELLSTEIVCDIANPLRRDHEKQIRLNLDMSNVMSDNGDDSLEFTIQAKSKSDDSNQSDNVLKLLLHLAVEADITIQGNSQKDSYYYGNDTLTNATHIFEVQKLGASPINEVQLNITIPVGIKTELNQQINFLQIYEPIGFQGGQPFRCQWADSYFTDTQTNDENDDKFSLEQQQRLKRSINKKENRSSSAIDFLPLNRTVFLNCSMDSIVCQNVTCMIGPFKWTVNVARLQIRLLLNVTVLTNYILGNKDIIYLSTDGYIKEIDGQRKDSVRVSNIFITEPPRQTVDSWVIIVSVIVGILILLLLILGLIKAGFFVRKQKMELEALKEAEDKSRPKYPTHLCFLDWQLSHVAPPVLDLLYFIYACTSKEVRDNHLDELYKDYYYKTLKQFTSELGSDIEKLYPYSVMQKQLEENGCFGLITAVMLLPLVTSDSDDIPDINQTMEQKSLEEAMEAFNFTSRNVLEYRTRMRDVILDVIDRKYI